MDERYADLVESLVGRNEARHKNSTLIHCQSDRVTTLRIQDGRSQIARVFGDAILGGIVWGIAAAKPQTACIWLRHVPPYRESRAGREQRGPRPVQRRGARHCWPRLPSGARHGPPRACQYIARVVYLLVHSGVDRSRATCVELAPTRKPRRLRLVAGPGNESDR